MTTVAALDLITRSMAQLQPVLDRTGALLYSSVETLRRGRYYVLGLNPAIGCDVTIRQCLEQLPEYRENAYLQDDWSDDHRHYERGGHPLQRHVCQVLNVLKEDPRDVCAANLIFTSSSGQGDAGYPSMADLCWPVHLSIIGIVQPEVLVVFGNGRSSPYDYIRRLHAQTFGQCPDEESRDALHGSWTVSSFETEIGHKKVTVIGLPHLSRYTIEGKPVVAKWIRSKAM